MASALRAARQEDLRSGHTSVGPHRDDVAIALSGMTARSFASQGQQRSIVLALKLAEAGVLALSCGEGLSSFSTTCSASLTRRGRRTCSDGCTAVRFF